ncbi:glycerol-3-phosphate acyltransferase PlsY [Laceyella sediminis]|uniref:Glycerol-3-phosphate acyltransferase PlsY n=1 Tax=Laceyella sediminis TaxID=573074 RepID=A0ABX5ESU4_9BACL|nr:glycerol-3-phosphate acyltransferase [Laceyella sediminis]PRZ14763.1 glycerol-3-phosphate acyltransferase PlsY [Laceyella sediminis]
MTWLLVLGLAYVIGAFPCHWWACSRPHSEQNGVGYAQLPLKEAFLLLVIDLVKGMAATLLGFALLGWVGAYLAAILVVVGSVYSCFLDFRGGTGLGVAAGVLLILSPILVVVGVMIFILAMLLVRSLFVATLLTGVALFLFGMVLATHVMVWLIVLVLCVVIWSRWRGKKPRSYSRYKKPPWRKRW